MKLKYKIPKKYLFYFLLGGILFCLLKYFSETKNTLICSIIPAIPILFLTGLFFLDKHNANIKEYTLLSIKTITIYVLFLFVFLYLLYKKVEIKVSLLISLYFFIIVYLICFLKNAF